MHIKGQDSGGGDAFRIGSLRATVLAFPALLFHRGRISLGCATMSGSFLAGPPREAEQGGKGGSSRTTSVAKGESRGIFFDRFEMFLGSPDRPDRPNQRNKRTDETNERAKRNNPDNSTLKIRNSKLSDRTYLESPSQGSTHGKKGCHQRPPGARCRS